LRKGCGCDDRHGSATLSALQRHNARPHIEHALRAPRHFRLVHVSGILGRLDNAMRTYRRWHSLQGASLTLRGHRRAQNSNRVADRQSSVARSAWPRSANSSCRRWSHPHWPLQISPSEVTEAKTREGFSLTWSGSIICSKSVIALLMRSSEQILWRSQTHADVKPDPSHYQRNSRGPNIAPAKVHSTIVPPYQIAMNGNESSVQ